MRLELTGRHITVTPAIRRLIEQRLAPMLRLLNDSAVSAQVVLRKEKTRVHAEVTLHARGEHFLHGEATGRDVDTALSAAADKVDRQVRSLKSRWSKGKRQGVSAAKARESYEQALEVARAAGIEDAVRPLVEIRLRDLERLEHDDA